jgi:hypothetical protein
MCELSVNKDRGLVKLCQVIGERTPVEKLGSMGSTDAGSPPPLKQEAYGSHRSLELFYIYGLGVRISTVFEIFGHFLY